MAHPYTLGIGIKYCRAFYPNGPLSNMAIGFAGRVGFEKGIETRDPHRAALEIARHSAARAIEIGEPADDAEARTLGFENKKAWSGYVEKILSLCPESVREKVVFLPRGSTQALLLARCARK